MDVEKISVTDEWLYKYMPIVDEAIIRELENKADYEYQFSGRFECRMKKLIRREAHPWRNAFYRLTKKAVVLFVCVAGFLFVIAMSVQAYRIKLFETAKSIWEDSVFYSYTMNQEQEAFRCNEPGYIPEGYRETERIVLEHWFSVTYASEDGRIITWDQMLVQDGGGLITDIEYDRQVTREVNGMNVVISLYRSGFVNAYYEHGGYAYVLTADNLDIDEVCLMFENIAAN